MRGTAGFVYHGSSVDTIGRTVILPCSSDGPDTRPQSRVFHTPFFALDAAVNFNSFEYG